MQDHRRAGPGQPVARAGHPGDAVLEPDLGVHAEVGDLDQRDGLVGLARLVVAAFGPPQARAGGAEEEERGRAGLRGVGRGELEAVEAHPVAPRAERNHPADRGGPQGLPVVAPGIPAPAQEAALQRVGNRNREHFERVHVHVADAERADLASGPGLLGEPLDRVVAVALLAPAQCPVADPRALGEVCAAEILRGPCDAVARNYKSSIVKGRPAVGPVAMIGAVS